MEREQLADIRRANLVRLIETHKPQKAFAERLGMEATQLSALKVGRRDVGEHMARRIEEACRLPRGWLDFQRDSLGGPVTTGIPTGHVEIERHDDGRRPMSTSPVYVPEIWLLEKGLSASDLRVIDAPDNTQSGRIERGDPVIVNKNFHFPLEHDRVYAIRSEDGLILRRAVRGADDAVTLCCRDGVTPDVTLTEAEELDLSVFGVCERAVIDL